MGIPVVFEFGQLVVCLLFFFMLEELNEKLDQLRHFCGSFRRISGPVLYHSLFFSWVEAVMLLISPILGLTEAAPRFFSFSLFSSCIVLVAHVIV